MNGHNLNFQIPQTLLKTLVGFETVLGDIANRVDNYPPHNIEILGADEYKISLAVAGFSREELSVKAKEGTLTISGSKAEKPKSSDESQEDDTKYPMFAHKGISFKPFERKFKMAEYVTVKSSQYENGLLTVNLVRNVPEDQKEKHFDIG